MPERKYKINKCFITTVAKFCIYSTLLVVFVSFYLKNQVADFSQGRTATSSQVLRVSEFEIPTAIFCMNPGIKPTVAKKHNLVDVFHVFSLNETFSKVFEEISYILNDDYEILITNKPLKVGNNVINGEDFDLVLNVELIRTMHHGTCYKLQTNHKLQDPTYHLPIYISLNTTEDVPKQLMITFTSSDSWHGISTDYWPTLKPTRAYIDLSLPYTELKMIPTLHRFKRGCDSGFDCLNELAATLNSTCTNVCSYITFGSLPLCNTGSEFWCNFDQVFSMYAYDKSPLINCLSPREALTFDTYSLSPQIFTATNTSKVSISFLYATMEIKEELDVITTAELIGNFGGSMGMFFGFSLASPILQALHRLIDRIF